MLSNTEDRKPRPSAVCHDATGSSSTGISEAHGDEREQEDRALEGLRHDLPVGPAQRRGREDHDPHRKPDHRHDVEHGGEFQVGDDIRQDRDDQDRGDDAEMRPFDPQPARRVLQDRRMAMLLQRGRDAVDQEAGRGRHIGARGRDSGLMPSIHIMVVVVSPTTLPEPPAFEAATIAAR